MEHNSGTNPFADLLRACKRHLRSMALQWLNVHIIVDPLPALLYVSVLLFFPGVIVYLRQMDERVAIVPLITGRIFQHRVLPPTVSLMANPPFRPYSTSTDSPQLLGRSSY